MSNDRQKLIKLLQEAQSLADRLGEGIALYLIRNALMELQTGSARD
jgi:hypothetical protein